MSHPTGGDGPAGGYPPPNSHGDGPPDADRATSSSPWADRGYRGDGQPAGYPPSVPGSPGGYGGYGQPGYRPSPAGYQGEPARHPGEPARQQSGPAGYQGGPGYRPDYGAPAGYPPAGYHRPGYGYPAYRPTGPERHPEPMRPPLTGAEPSRGGSGTFIGLIVIMVLLVGALGYDKGLFGPGVLSWVQQQQQAYSPAPPADAVRPVRGPLTTSEAAALQRSVGPGLVNITAELTSQHAVGAGTGIKLTSDGEVLTNNHVIRGASSLKVTDIGNGHTYSATVIGYDEDHDIAVLQMRGASGLRTATLGDSDSVQIGDQVAAIGNAGGVGGRPSVATGPVTDLDRTINTSDELTGTRERLTGLIEANANVQPGDSGGPMVNTEGEVIGVDVAASVDARSQTPDGTGFAIPINSAMAVVRQIRSGSASDAVHIGETAMLGVSINPISDRAVREAAAELGQPLPTHNGATGAYVTSVGYASPAQQVGLEGGDVITSLDGAPVDSATRLKTLINTHRPGDRVAVSWVQPTGRQQSASVQLVPGPPN